MEAVPSRIVRWITIPLLFLSACSVGPTRLQADRISYTEAISESWKTQMLLNIVKLRYMDAPVFLEVQQILAGYTLEGSASVGWAENGLASGFGVGGAGKFTDRPTITYRPMSGGEFAKSFMRPIPPSAIFFLLQAGYSADYVLPLCVQSINGLRNYSGAVSMLGEADDRFVRLVKAMSKAQKLGALGMRVLTREKASTTVLFFPQGEHNPEAAAVEEEIEELLSLDKNRREFTVEYSTAPGGGDKIVMLTRSALTIMFEMAVQIDVPEEHAKANYTVPVPPIDESIRLFRVHSGTSDPGNDGFVRTKYEGYWFWIRKDDLRSKRTFSFLRLLFGFVDKGEPPPPTLVTVAAG